MKRKSKLFFSIASMMFAIALLCFGVYAALSVSYTISGSVAYEVKDAFVEIKTKVYAIKNIISSQSDVNNYAKQVEQWTDSEILNDVESKSGKLVREFETYNTLLGTGENTADGIDVNYNNYYTYIIVVNVKNLSSDNELSVVLNNQLNNDTNSYTYISPNVYGLTKPTSGNNDGVNMVIVMSLKDATLSTNTTFEYELNVNSTTENEDVEQTNSLTYVIQDSNVEITTNTYYTSDSNYANGDAMNSFMNELQMVSQAYPLDMVKTLLSQSFTNSSLDLYYNSSTITGADKINNLVESKDTDTLYIIAMSIKNIHDDVITLNITNLSDDVDATTALYSQDVMISPNEETMLFILYLVRASQETDVENFMFKLQANGFNYDEIEFTEEDLAHFAFTPINNGTEWQISANKDNLPSGFVIIPSEYQNKPVTKIADAEYQDSITDDGLTLKDNASISLKTFTQNSAFTLLDNVTAIYIPSSIKEIGVLAFAYSEFKQIFLNEGLQTIKLGAFLATGVPIKDGNVDLVDGTVGYISIKLPDSVTTLGEHALSCTMLAGVYVGSGLQYCFDYFVSYSILDFAKPFNIKVSPDNQYFTSRDNDGNEIGCIMEKSSKKLIQMSSICTEIPQNIDIQEISEWAFYKGSYENLIIPDTVNNLEAGTFDFESVQKLIIPSSITSLPDYLITHTWGTVRINNLEIYGEKTFSSANVVFGKPNYIDLSLQLTINSLTLHSLGTENKRLLNELINIGDTMGNLGLQTVYVPSEYVQELTNYYASVYTQEGYNGSKPNFVAIS